MLVQIYMLCFVILTWLFAASAEGPFFSFRCITYRFVIAVLLRFIISNKLIITYNHLLFLVQGQIVSFTQGGTR